ncbi:MAG TPA: sulfatase [Polyangiaceae bacterium]|nr:sulfatase [Polyangiaceae bacterium]
MDAGNGEVRWRLNAEAAQLVAWAALALLNQAIIAFLLPPASLGRSLLHRAFDFGQLLAAGALSWGFVLAVRWLGQRSGARQTRGAEAAVLAAVVFTIGLATAGADVSNLAERLEAPRWLLVVGISAAFGLALGGSRLLQHTAGPLRGVQAVVGVALALVNAASVPRDYFACHLMAAWLAALMLANALEGLSLRFRAVRGWLLVELGAVLWGAAAVVMPAPVDVQLRLQALPSSALAPFIVRLQPYDEQISSELVSAALKASAWFSDRKGAAEVPATRAIAPAQPPIVMFFTIDAFRANVLENADYLKQLPNLATLRRESSYFPVARSPTASTMTSMASIFSGRYYSQLEWGPNKKAPLVEKSPRFPELLGASGVRTLLLAPTLGRIYGASGVARGFAKEVMVPQKGRPAGVTVDAIIAELDSAPDGPQFIYSHFIEPHAPYDLAGKQGTSFERYLREIGLVDRELGRLRRFLARKGLAERTYFIISADHGEGFGEHGTFNHARTAYEELVRVPFFFYLPGRSGQELPMQVTSMDIGPTVLDLFGLPTPGFWMGQSLLPLVAGDKKQLERQVAIDTGGHIQALCLSSGYKVIFTRPLHTTEVYDLKRDPGELVNLALDSKPETRQAIQIAAHFFDAIKRKDATFEGAESE